MNDSPFAFPVYEEKRCFAGRLIDVMENRRQFLNTTERVPSFCADKIDDTDEAIRCTGVAAVYANYKNLGDIHRASQSIPQANLSACQGTDRVQIENTESAAECFYRKVCFGLGRTSGRRRRCVLQHFKQCLTGLRWRNVERDRQ